jgi:hypothetical protein
MPGWMWCQTVNDQKKHYERIFPPSPIYPAPVYQFNMLLPQIASQFGGGWVGVLFFAAGLSGEKYGAFRAASNSYLSYCKM